MSAEEAEELVRLCSQHLCGKSPAISGAALAELVSLWLGGHHPALRRSVRAQWLQLVENLLEHNAQPLERFAPKEPLQ